MPLGSTQSKGISDFIPWVATVARHKDMFALDMPSGDDKQSCPSWLAKVLQLVSPLIKNQNEMRYWAYIQTVQRQS
jgi:hypothetical protein